MQKFSNALHHSEDKEHNPAIDKFLEREVNGGKAKIYTYNPIYETIARRDSENLRDEDYKLVEDYVYVALSSSLSGDELRKAYPYCEAFMINWGVKYGEGSERQKQTIMDAVTRAATKS